MPIVEQHNFYNAFTYRECLIPLENQGFVYMGGKNGSGKSTPWDIFQHTLYGTTSRGLRKKGIVCTVPHEDDDETGYLSEIIFRHEAGPYKGRWMVRQARDHEKYDTCLHVMKEIDGEWSKRWHNGACPTRLEDAQKLAGKIFGLRQNEFEGCMYLSQVSTHTLIEGKPTEKMLYLSYLFSIDRYDDVLKGLKARLSDVDKKLLGTISLESKLEDLRANLVEMEPADWFTQQFEILVDTRDLAKTALSDWSGKRDAARDLISGLDQRAKMQSELDALGDVDTSKFEEVKGELQTLTDKRDSLRDRIKSVELRKSMEAKVNTLLEGVEETDPQAVGVSITEKQKRRGELGNTIKQLRERADLEKALAAVSSSDLELADLEEQVDFLTTSVAEQSETYRQKISEHKRLVGEIDNGVCERCERPFEGINVEDLRKTKEALGVECRSLHKKMEKPKANLKHYKEQLEDARSAHTIKAKLEDLPEGEETELKAERAQLKTEITNLDAAREKLTQAEALEVEYKPLPTGDLENLNEQVSMIEVKLPALQEKHDGMSQAVFLEKNLAELPSSDREDAERDLALATESYAELFEDLESVREQITVVDLDMNRRIKLVEDIVEIEVEVDSLSPLRRRRQILQYAMVAVPKLKKRKLHQIVCAIRDVLPRYAGAMFSHEPNTSFLVDDDDGSGESIDLLARRMVSVHGRREPVLVPVKGFSGGEKQRLSVALLFTLHSLLDPSKRPDVLILDEVDKGLDDSGVASLMALIGEVKSQYGTVIMTSHRTQISGAKFDRVWRVNKDNEVSSLLLSA